MPRFYSGRPVRELRPQPEPARTLAERDLAQTQWELRRELERQLTEEVVARTSEKEALGAAEGPGPYPGKSALIDSGLLSL